MVNATHIYLLHFKFLPVDSCLNVNNFSFVRMYMYVFIEYIANDGVYFFPGSNKIYV